MLIGYQIWYDSTDDHSDNKTVLQAIKSKTDALTLFTERFDVGVWYSPSDLTKRLQRHGIRRSEQARQLMVQAVRLGLAENNRERFDSPQYKIRLFSSNQKSVKPIAVGEKHTMLIGYEIWDNRTDKPAGYATVNQTAGGEMVDIEVTHCTIPNSNPEIWVATAWRLCCEHNLAGVVFHHEASTVTISEITPF